MFLSQQKTIRPISSLYKKYVELTMSISSAFTVISDEDHSTIPIIEETTEGRISQEPDEEDETIPDDTDRSIFEQCKKLTSLTKLEDLKEKIKKSHENLAEASRRNSLM